MSIFIAMPQHAHAVGNAAHLAQPSGRIEISHDPAAQPQGWNTAPTSEDEARSMGYTRESAGATNVGAYWSRWIEIVPAGSVPKIDSLTYYVKDDGDFSSPERSDRYLQNRPTEAQEISVPRASNDIPNFTFGPDNSAANAAIPFYGAQTQIVTSGYSTKRVFLTLNPNGALPTTSESYYAQSTKYSPQTGFKEVPQLRYITPILGKNAGLFPDPGATGAKEPDYQTAYTKFRRAYMQLLDTSVADTEPAYLDERMKVGEVRKAFRTLLNGGSLTNENVSPASDKGTAEDYDTVRTAFDRVINNRQSAIVQALSYAQAHYLYGMRASDIDDFTLDSGENTTVVTRAFARLLLAYTDASPSASLIPPIAGIAASSIDVKASELADKSVFTWRFQESQASEISVDIPAQFRGKVTFSSTARKVRDYPLTYELTPHDTYTLEVVNNPARSGREDISGISFRSNEFEHSSLYHTFMPKKDYKRDPVTGHWMVRQSYYVPSGKAQGDRARAPLAGTTTAAPLISFQDASSHTALFYNADLYLPGRLLASRVEAGGVTAHLYEVADAARDENEPSYPAVLYTANLTPKEGSAGGESGARYEVPVKDTLFYYGLESDRDYFVWSQVLPVSYSNTGAVGSVGDAVLSHGHIFRPESTVDHTATYEISLGSVEINPDVSRHFVVFESVTPVANVMNLEEVLAGRAAPEYRSNAAVIRHEEPEDRAQSFSLYDPKVATGVQVIAGSNSSDNSADTQIFAAGVAGYTADKDSAVEISRENVALGSEFGTSLRVGVRDVFYFENPEAGRQTRVEASLYELGETSGTGAAAERGIVGKPIATYTSQPFTASNDPGKDYGTHIADFGQVELTPGKSYVVYERLVATDGTVMAIHEDPNSLAQRIIVQPDPQRSLTVMELPDSGVDWRMLLALGLVPVVCALAAGGLAFVRGRRL